MTLALPLPRAGGGRVGRPAVAGPVAFVAVCLVVLAAGVGWRVGGGTWAVIETPSMGRAAPVGTLILTRPVTLAALRVGDVVTYRPRTAQDKMYTHRVVAKNPDGSVQVRGDINGADDPLPVTQADLVGRVVHAWRGVGWLVRALPTLLLAGVVLLVATAYYVPARWRSSARVLGSSLLLALTSLTLHPFVHPILIAVTDTGSGPRASLVSGGLLPTRVTGAAGHHVDLLAGQTGTVPVEVARPGAPIAINGSPVLHGWWLVGMVVVCLLPMLWTTVFGLGPEEDAEDGEGGEP